MIVDGAGLSDGEELGADCVVVGAGPAGLTLALALEGSGRRVVLLESGGLEPDEATLSLLAGPAGEPPDPYGLRHRQFGGTANLWGARMRDGRQGVRYAMLDETDFEAKPGVPHSGWPFPRSHLDPYYDRARAFLGLAPFDVSLWEDRDDARRLEIAGGRFAHAVVQFGPRDVFLEDCRARVAASPDVHAYLNLNAVEVEADEGAARASRVRVATLAGRRLAISAGTVVLAAGGIENARLLLMSRGANPAGLGNQNDAVGRYFMDHYGHFGGMLFPADRRIFDRMALYDLRRVGGHDGMGIVVPSPEAIRRESLLNTATYLPPKPPAYHHSRGSYHAKRLLKAKLLGRPVERKPERPSGVGEMLLRLAAGSAAYVPRKLHRKFVARRPFPQTSINEGGWSDLPDKPREFAAIEVHQHFEQAPDPDNRVLLSDDRDRLGCPRARVERRLTEIDRRSLDRTNAMLREDLARSGLGRFAVDRDFVTPEFSSNAHGAAHHMGSTRMHDDPKRGVVDASCRVHGVANLYVAGSSVFPTGGFANPTLTIVALALRLADHLKAEGPARA